jgi:membrane fusion protein (multidrug efflux system)
MILMLVFMVAVFGGIFGFWAYKVIKMGKMMAAMKPPPVTVSAIKATEETWQPAMHAVGSLVAVHGVVLANELSGVVDKIDFESGSLVEKGAVLVHLNTSSEEAQLRSLEATTELARQTLDRAKQLREANVNAQSDLDSATAQYDQAVANADNVRATIAKKTITAPFAGRVGIRQVDLGQFLAVGTPVVSLQSLDPIYVNFTLPQQDIKNIETGQKVEISIDAYPGAKFSGEITASDTKLDDATRSVQIQATLSNADGRLRPGMFCSVDVLLPVQDKTVTLPQSAIIYNPYGDAVYVIEPAMDKDGKPLEDAKGNVELVTHQQFVIIGTTRGDQVSIIKGVKAGDMIVTAGQLKLRNGTGVVIDNQVPVSNSPAPTPPNT